METKKFELKVNLDPVIGPQPNPNYNLTQVLLIILTNDSSPHKRNLNLKLLFINYLLLYYLLLSLTATKPGETKPKLSSTVKVQLF